MCEEQEGKQTDRAQLFYIFTVICVTCCEDYTYSQDGLKGSCDDVYEGLHRSFFNVLDPGLKRWMDSVRKELRRGRPLIFS